MAEQHKERLPHLLLPDIVRTDRYTRPGTGGGGKFKTPPRSRSQHAASLIKQFETTREQGAEALAEQKAAGFDTGNGIYLTFESEPGFDLKFESLEYQRSGIELCAVKTERERNIATVFVPEGKLDHFLSKIVRYRDEDKPPTDNNPDPGPKEQALVESISAIKLAALRQLFTDPDDEFPTDEQAIWWEVWLRASPDIDYQAYLREHAQHFELHVSPGASQFMDRSVVLVRGSRSALSPVPGPRDCSAPSPRCAVPRTQQTFLPAWTAWNRANGSPRPSRASTLPLPTPRPSAYWIQV